MTKIKYIILGLSLAIVGYTFLIPNQVTASVVDYSTINTQALIELTNIERVQSGLSRLKESTNLNVVARLKAEDMVKNGYFSHNSNTGKGPWYWFKMVGYKYLNAGENLAILFNSPKSVVRAWMNSPSHRANILNPKFTEVGVAVVTGNYNGNPTSYIVEVFGNPDYSKLRVEIVPKIKKKVL